MIRSFLTAALIPMAAAAQAFPTEFPSNAQPLDSTALEKRLAGKAFAVKAADGTRYRIQYDKSHAHLNLYSARGTINDSGPWRVESSSVCIEWRQVKSGCSEFRLVGDVLYTKRASNGEVVVMDPE